MSISSVTENLAQLMFSMMMTGYMFRNAQYRLELQKSVLSTRASLKGAVPRGSVELSAKVRQMPLNMFQSSSPR